MTSIFNKDDFQVNESQNAHEELAAELREAVVYAAECYMLGMKELTVLHNDGVADLLFISTPLWTEQKKMTEKDTESSKLLSPKYRTVTIYNHYYYCTDGRIQRRQIKYIRFGKWEILSSMLVSHEEMYLDVIPKLKEKDYPISDRTIDGHYYHASEREDHWHALKKMAFVMRYINDDWDGGIGAKSKEEIEKSVKKYFKSQLNSASKTGWAHPEQM